MPSPSLIAVTANLYHWNLVSASHGPITMLLYAKHSLLDAPITIPEAAPMSPPPPSVPESEVRFRSLGGMASRKQQLGLNAWRPRSRYTMQAKCQLEQHIANVRSNEIERLHLSIELNFETRFPIPTQMPVYVLNTVLQVR